VLAAQDFPEAPVDEVSFQENVKTGIELFDAKTGMELFDAAELISQKVGSKFYKTRSWKVPDYRK
jgi:hypothetical protein